MYLILRRQFQNPIHVKIYMIFSTIVFIMNAVSQGGKKGESGGFWSLPDPCHVDQQHSVITANFLFLEASIHFD